MEKSKKRIIKLIERNIDPAELVITENTAQDFTRMLNIVLDGFYLSKMEDDVLLYNGNPHLLKIEAIKNIFNSSFSITPLQSDNSHAKFVKVDLSKRENWDSDNSSIHFTCFIKTSNSIDINFLFRDTIKGKTLYTHSKIIYNNIKSSIIEILITQYLLNGDINKILNLLQQRYGLLPTLSLSTMVYQHRGLLIKAYDLINKQDYELPVEGFSKKRCHEMKMTRKALPFVDIGEKFMEKIIDMQQSENNKNNDFNIKKMKTLYSNFAKK